MEEIIGNIQEIALQNVALAPLIIFSLLLLAGFNIPISEDAMLFLSGFLAAKNPTYTVHFFTGVFLGAFLSDIICFYVGRILGPKLWKIKAWSKMVPQENVEKISHYYEKYGIITLILGRFIPFGVRNGLFLTAGLGKMNALKFALSDLLACTISCSTYFYLYYTYSTTAIEYVKKSNLLIFSIAIIITSTLIFLKRKKKNN
ncbi:DedA family protein [Bacteriovoracaceae bacterium]|nr:DedA family protein [Bacteriovoracaceae bacterium]